MHKLKLELESLVVDSFATVPGDEARGTVQAFASVGDSTCRWAICYYETYAPGCTLGETCAYSCNCATNGGASCVYTCGYTCGYTCANTCAGNTCENCPAPTDP